MVLVNRQYFHTVLDRTQVAGPALFLQAAFVLKTLVD